MVLKDGELNITPRQLSDVLKHLEANEIVDLKDFSLPILGEADPNNGIARWKEKLSELVGYIFALAEYNHSVPKVLKNALNYVGTEMANKAAAIVSYGAAAGARSAEHLRAIFGQTNTADNNTNVLLSLFYNFENFTTFKPLDIHGTNLDQLFKSLDAWSKALQTIR